VDYIDKYVQPVDPEIAEAIRQEELRQNEGIGSHRGCRKIG
jgi:hypothetical protein